MVEFDECNCCAKKTTTSGCLTCIIYKLKLGITQINEFIDEHKSNLNNYIFYFNKEYYDIVENALNLNLIANFDIRITPMLETSQIGIIVDKTKFDWGDIKYN